MKKSLIITALLVIFASANAAYSEVTFNFIYTDSTGEGFYDPLLGQARRDALESVGQYMASMINTSFDVTVDIEISSYNSPYSGTLASAGQYYYPKTGYISGLAERAIMTGVEYSGTEALMDWNFGQDFYIGSGTPGSYQYDFRSIALHELTHIIGFTSLIESDGSGYFMDGSYSKFDDYLYDGNGNKLIDGSPLDCQNVDALTSEVWFRDDSTGTNVRLYTPSTWSDGSSISHTNEYWDNMYYAIGGGHLKREWTENDLAILSALGYDITPEPSMTLVLLGSGATLLIQKKRRHPSAA